MYSHGGKLLRTEPARVAVLLRAGRVKHEFSFYLHEALLKGADARVRRGVDIFDVALHLEQAGFVGYGEGVEAAEDFGLSVSYEFLGCGKDFGFELGAVLDDGGG